MAKVDGKGITNRAVKDSAFTAYFGEPENACKLYAALGDGEVSPEDIAYVTLDGVLFIARKNDLAFTVKNRVLVISEHQSTLNENMPLRDLLYLGRTLEKLLDERMIYRRRLFQIPTPEFYVFYNGDEPCPPEKILRLSDAFLDQTEHPMVELIVKVININLPSGHKLLKDCRPMYEYSWFIQRIKDYLGAGWVRDEAITQAVKDCMEEGILTEFMREHGSEVVNMLYTQWNYDDAVAVEREEAYEDGRLAESRQVIYSFLKQLGEIPEDIRSSIEREQDSEVLKKWYMTAPRIKSFEEFRIFIGGQRQNASEVVNMLHTQWNYDDAVAVEREKAYEDGLSKGREEGLTRGRIAEARQVMYTFLEQLGEIPDDIRSRIEGEQDSEVLKKWYTAAPLMKSFAEFRENMCDRDNNGD